MLIWIFPYNKLDITPLYEKIKRQLLAKMANLQ